jgi:molybdopterin molybdotransferase
MSPLRPLADALAALLDSVVDPPGVETVALGRACGRILAADLVAIRDVPPTDNSAMDGYALRAADAGRSLPVAQRIAAGDEAAPLAAGTVARIFTGAPLPAGADAVVMQEDCLADGDHVQLPAAVEPGAHLRRRGQDCALGERLLRAGRRLRPQDIGLAASQGYAGLEVHRRLRVALISTGSELRLPGEGEPAPGQIYNSNGPMLSALLDALCCEVVDMGIVADDREATGRALEDAAAADVIVSSGGVSVGEADHVREQVAARGAIDLWRIAIKPGKPFAFGHVGATPFLGLPGNPSSALVTFLVLARPYLCALQGRREPAAPALPVRADFKLPEAGSRAEFLRASLERRGDELWALPYVNQSSGVLSSVCASNALVLVPPGTTVERGMLLDAWPLDTLLA